MLYTILLWDDKPGLSHSVIPEVWGMWNNHYDNVVEWAKKVVPPDKTFAIAELNFKQERSKGCARC